MAIACRLTARQVQGFDYRPEHEGTNKTPQKIQNKYSYCIFQFASFRLFLCLYVISLSACLAILFFLSTYLSIRVQWFWLFFTFWGITTHPWHPKGPRIWKLAKNFFQLQHGLRKFLAKTGKCVFLVWFQSLMLGAPFDRSLPFFRHVLFMGSLIHI